MTRAGTPTPLTNADIAAVQRRTLIVVVLSQILGGAGFAAGITVGSLLAKDMLGSEGWSGISLALITAGSAVAAFIVGRTTNRWGRRVGLSTGFAVGGMGGLGIVWAAAADSVPLLFVSLLIYGSGTATNLQGRYAGTDLAAPDRRGRAISISLVATTFGAVAGPSLVNPLGSLAESMHLPSLSGPFLMAAVAYLVAAVVLWVMLRPDPYLVARSLVAPPAPGDVPIEPAGTGAGAVLGGAVMVLSQVIMVGVMTMTPVHMREHDHGLGAVGIVIALHIAAMYLPSPITGIAVDRFGRAPMAFASAATLLLAGVVAAVSPGDSMVLLTVALLLLGLGWNFGLIAGTALVVDATEPERRPRVQGSVDVLVALGGAGGALSSGVVMSASSFEAMSIAGGALSVLLLPVLWWSRGKL